MKATLIPGLVSALLAGLFPAPSRAESVVVQWEKIYNGPGADLPSFAALDSAGNVIVTGSSYDTHDTSGDADIYTAKYAAGNGGLLWERRYDGPANDTDKPNALAVDSGGNVIVAGITVTDSGWFDGYAAMYAATNGALLWEKRYDGPVHRADEFEAVALDSAGNVIVTGRTATYRSGNSWAEDFYTAKYAASNGALLWEKIYRPTGSPQEVHDRSYKVVVDSGGNVIIAGYTDDGSGNAPVTVVKYAAANGALLWSVRPTMKDTFALSVDSAENVIVAGWSLAGGGSPGIQTAKFAASSGALLWDKRYDLTGQIYFSATVKVDDDGNVVVTVVESDGSLVPLIATLNTVKYARTDGSLISENQNHYRVPGRPRDIELDAADNAFITGDFDSSGSGDFDMYTAKYASGSGILLWEMRYNGTDNLIDHGGRLLVDGSGSVIISGRTNAEPDAGYMVGGDYYTVKYTPVDVDLDEDGLLDSWETENFGGTAGQSALDDTDGDGAVELLELAFGTNPRAANSVSAPAVVVEGGYLTTTIMKQPCMRYLVETGATLESGFSAASTTVLTDTATTLKVRDNVLIGARFLRVQVTAPP